MVDRLQVPLDGKQGESSGLPEGCDQAEQVDAQPLLTQGFSLQVGLGDSPLPTAGTDPGDKAVLGDLYRGQGNLDHLPSPLHPVATQPCAAVGAGVQGIVYPMGGRYAPTDKAMASGLPGFFGLSRLLRGLGLVTGHPFGSSGLGLPFQDLNAPLQLDDEGLLLLDQRMLLLNHSQQGLPRGVAKVIVPIHTPLI